MKGKLTSGSAIQLKKQDKILGQIIINDLEPLASRGTVYEGILRAIISQQVSVAAATAVRKKVEKCFGGKLPSPEKLLQKSQDDLRSCGLSRQKISYFKNVAKHWMGLTPGPSPKERGIEQCQEKFLMMSDQEIIDDLTKIKGVGEWTVEMLLIFNLLRPDIFSVKDLGLLKSIYKLYKINPKHYKAKNLKIKILKISQNWKPYRSLACRYLWNFKDF